MSGKSFVLHHAVERQDLPEGTFCLFLDADVRIAPDALWRAMRFVRENELRAFSGSGVYPNPGFVAELLEAMMYTFVFLYMPIRRINDPSAPDAWLNGQLILIDAATYRAVGGHAAVREHAFDDLSFGKHLTRSGVPYRFCPAAQLFTCVNYVGLREAHAGWTRLLAGGTPWIGLDRGFFAAVVLELLGVWLLPPLLVVGLLTGLLPREGLFGLDLLPVALGQVGFVLVVHALNRLGMAVSALRAPLYPFASVLALRAMAAGYVARYRTRSFAFRGRELRPDDVG